MYVLVGSLLLCSCGILPTEEEFDRAPMVKEYEGNDYNKYTVTRGDMVQKENIDARYQGTSKEDVYGEGSGGRVKEVNVKKGQKVEIGDVLVKNYLPDQEKIIEDSKNQIEALELQIRQAKEMKAAELEKLEKTGGNKEQKENVRSQYDSQIVNCQSSLKLARLDLEAAEEEIEINETTSDIDGTVTFVDHSFDGGYAGSEDVLVTVQGKKRNRFRAKTKYAGSFAENQKTILTVAGHQYQVRVKRGSEKNVVYFYPATALSLEDGIVGSVELVLKEKKDVLFVPASLVYDMGDKKIVYMEGENGVKSIREVKVGEQIDNFIEITEGLEENQQIITS